MVAPGWKLTSVLWCHPVNVTMGRLVSWFCCMGKGAGRTFMVTELGGRRESNRERLRQERTGESSCKSTVDPHMTCVVFPPPVPGSLSPIEVLREALDRFSPEAGVVCALTGSGLTQELMIPAILCRTSDNRRLRATRSGAGERQSEAAMTENMDSSAKTGQLAQVLLHCSLAVQIRTSINLSRLWIIEEVSVMDWIVSSPNSYVEALTPPHLSTAVFGHRVFAEVIKLKCCHWSGPLSNVTGILIRKGN